MARLRRGLRRVRWCVGRVDGGGRCIGARLVERVMRLRSGGGESLVDVSFDLGN